METNVECYVDLFKKKVKCVMLRLEVYAISKSSVVLRD